MQTKSSTYFLVDSVQGESLKGYLLRLADHNGLEQASWIASVPNELERIAELYGNTLFGRIPNLSFSNLKSLKKLAPPLSSSRLENLFSYCPFCIATIDYIPFYWEAYSYTTCHEHGCFMQNICPQCQRSVKWNRGTLRQCVCGFNLCETVPEMASPPEVKLCRSLAAALCNEYQCQPSGQAIIPDSVFSFACLRSLIRVLGSTALGNRPQGQPSLDDFSSYQTNHASIMTTRTAWLLDDWPHNFRQFLLDNQCYFGGEQLPSYKSGVYDRFTRQLNEEKENPDLAFLVHEYRNFIAHNWPKVLTRKTKWLTEAELEEQTFVPANLVTRVLGRTLRHVRELVREEKLEGKIKRTSCGREFCIVSRRSLFEYQAKASEEITELTARSLLGISKTEINKLVTAGFLAVRGQSLLFGDKGGRRKFQKKEIFEVLAQIYSYGKLPSDDEDSMSYAVACKNVLTVAEAENLLLAVVSRSIPVLQTHSAEEWNLEKAVFAKSDVYGWLDKVRYGDASNGLNVQELARKLNVKEEVAYFLIRKKFITSYRVKVGRRSCQRVSEVSVSEFTERYIAAVEIARAMNTSSNAVIRRMMSIQVLPAIGLPTNTCRQVFYRRDEIADRLSTV